MARRKNTTTTQEQEYKKELRRIQAFLRRARKRGFIWANNPVPKTPKKITEASVAKLKRLTPNVLYQKGEYINEATGELLSGGVGRNLELKGSIEKANKTKKAKQNKVNTSPKANKQTEYIFDPDDEETYGEQYYPSFTDIVLSTFLATLKQFPNAEGVQVLLEWYDTLIADNGRAPVAQMLQDGAANGLVVTWETVYKSTATKTYMDEMIKYLPGTNDLYESKIRDMMEQIEWWEKPE